MGRKKKADQNTADKKQYDIAKNNSDKQKDASDQIPAHNGKDQIRGDSYIAEEVLLIRGRLEGGMSFSEEGIMPNAEDMLKYSKVPYNDTTKKLIQVHEDHITHCHDYDKAKIQAEIDECKAAREERKFTSIIGFILIVIGLVVVALIGLFADMLVGVVAVSSMGLGGIVLVFNNFIRMTFKQQITKQGEGEVGENEQENDENEEGKIEKRKRKQVKRNKI